MNRWVIVKHAQENVWDHYFIDDPKLGVHNSYSCHTSFSGVEAGVLPFYTDLQLAEQHCALINKNNPVGAYAVCPLNN